MNRVPGAQSAPYVAPNVQETPLRLNAVPQVQPQGMLQMPQQLQAPPQAYPQGLLLYPQQLQPQAPAPQQAQQAAPAPQPVYAPAQIPAQPQGAPLVAPVPAAALAPQQPVPMTAQQMTLNPVPGGVAPVLEPPVKLNEVPQVGVGGLLSGMPFGLVSPAAPMATPAAVATNTSTVSAEVLRQQIVTVERMAQNPPPGMDPSAWAAAMAGQIAQLQEQLAQAAPPAPKPLSPTYYWPARSALGKQYLYRPSPQQVPGAQRFTAPANTMAVPRIDLRDICPPVSDCGGSAVGFAVAAMREALTCTLTGSLPLGRLSPHFVREVIQESKPEGDRGASIAEELAVLLAHGIAPVGHERPAADVVAIPWRVTALVQIEPTLQSIKSVLAQRLTIVVGFLARPSFEAPGEGGLLSLFGDDEAVLGMHAVLVVGYDDRGWIVRNCFGPEWGDGGYAIMPYGYERCWLEAWTATAPA